MSEEYTPYNLISFGGKILFFFTMIISILAWITYGSLQGVLGMLAYILIGLLNLFPWIIPFVGIPLGILDMLGIGIGMYNQTLNIAHLEPTWMSGAWYWIVSIFGILIEIWLLYLIIIWVIGLKHREKGSKQNLALTNCHIIDGNRSSKIIQNGVILIKNIVGENETPGLIVGVGPSDKVAITPEYKQVDLNGSYVLPGLINAHCHLFGSGKPMKVMNESDEMMKKIMKMIGTSVGKLLLMNMMKNNILNALNSGVTTLRSMGDPFYLDIKLRKISEEGKFLGPRLLVAGLGICPTGGHGGAMGFFADDVGELRKRVRKNVREGVDHIKIISTGGVMDANKIGEAGKPQMTVEEIEIACIESHRAGLLVAAHCESSAGIREALQGGVDTIEHGADIPEDLVPLFKKNPKSLRGYSALTPTISAGMGLATLPLKNTMITPIKLQNAKLIEKGMIQGLQRAYEKEIKFTCGTDAAVPYSMHYSVWKELKYFLKYTKMTPQEAIYFATKNTADIIGIGNVTGSIEVGKSADLQVVPGNPFENMDILGHVSQVIIGGHLIKHPKVKKDKKIEKNVITPIEI